MGRQELIGYNTREILISPFLEIQFKITVGMVKKKTSLKRKFGKNLVWNLMEKGTQAKGQFPKPFLTGANQIWNAKLG